MEPQRIPQPLQVTFDPVDVDSELVVFGNVQADLVGFFVEKEQKLAIAHVIQNVLLTQTDTHRKKRE